MNLLTASSRGLLVGLAFWGIVACAGPRATTPSPSVGEGPGRPSLLPWRVAVSVFEDLRPPEDRDKEARRLLGDGRYPYYTYDEEQVITPQACGFIGLCSAFTTRPVQIASVLHERLVERLKAAYLFTQVEPFPESTSSASGGAASASPVQITPDVLSRLTEKGFDALLVGKIARWYGLAYPSFSRQRYTMFTGTVEYPKQTKAIALVRLEQVELVSLPTQQVLWSGEVEYTIDRTERRTSARAIADEALEGAIATLLDRIKTVGTAQDRP